MQIPHQKRGWSENDRPLFWVGEWAYFLQTPFGGCGNTVALFDTAMKDTRAKKRPDQSGTHRTTYDRNKQRIYSTQSICGICGLPVDFSVKYPHPLSPCIDHIIPIAKGGHPSDIQNLQLAHWICNRQKSDKLVIKKEDQKKEVGNFDIPWSLDWESYRS